jgi:hypothetical protein
MREEGEPWFISLPEETFPLTRISSGRGEMSRDPGDYVLRWDPRAQEMRPFLRRTLEFPVLRLSLYLTGDADVIRVGARLVTPEIWRKNGRLASSQWPIKVVDAAD